MFQQQAYANYQFMKIVNKKIVLINHTEVNVIISEN